MRLLLDAHLSPSIGRELRKRGMDVESLRDWQGGGYNQASDKEVLLAALTEDRVLVTFDLRSIPGLLKDWAEAGQIHAGVVLVDERTIPPNDIGGLVNALSGLNEARGADDWRAQTVFLRRATE